MFRLSPFTVGMTKIGDNKLLMNYTKSHGKSQYWEIPDFFLLREPDRKEKLLQIVAQKRDEIFFWKVDGKHSGLGVFPMTGNLIQKNNLHYLGLNFLFFEFVWVFFFYFMCSSFFLNMSSNLKVA